jgi:type II secretory pathway component GspD/PulD (secretin)
MRVKHFSRAVIVLLATSAFGQAPSASPSPPNAKPPQSPAPHVYSSSCPVVDVCDVLAKYAALTHLKITRDNFVQGKVSIDDVSGSDTEKAIEIIERTLFSNGFAITQIDSDTVEVTGTGKSARSIGIPVISDPKALPTHERLVSFVFGFKYRNAKEMQQIFAMHLSPPQTWTSFLAEPSSNTVLVTERTSAIRKLIDIAVKMDVPDWKKQP